MKMKALLKDIVEAFVSTFFNFKSKKYVAHESKSVDITTFLLKIEESYDATSITKILFVILHWFFLVIAILFINNNLISAMSLVLSSLFFILFYNRKIAQATKAHFIRFVISSIKELDKTKIPGYQTRKPGIYEDNI